jgi:uncharacterized membrane protein YedE/YeeE
MAAFASLVCGFVFGWGLLISGMTQPAKVLGFLDIFGAWDATLAVVLAAALAITSAGFALARKRQPAFDARCQWPSNTAIDRPLVVGALLFGIGWGLVGLCPGPALENLATLSPRVIVFVAAMAIGMVAHDLLRRQRPAPAMTVSTQAATADG